MAYLPTFDMNQILTFQYILPFLLLFALTFAILEYRKIISDRRNINFIVALVVSGFALMSPMGPNLAGFFGTFAAKTGIFLVSMLFGLMVMVVATEVLAGSKGKAPEYESIGKWFKWISIIAIIMIFVSSGGLSVIAFNLNIPLLIAPETLANVTVIGFTVILFYTLLKAVGGKKREKHWFDALVDAYKNRYHRRKINV